MFMLLLSFIPETRSGAPWRVRTLTRYFKIDRLMDFTKEMNTHGLLYCAIVVVLLSRAFKTYI